MLRKFVIAYVDDILIYSQSPESQMNHIQEVLLLKISPTLCQRNVNSMSPTSLLGYIISPEGVSMKVTAVVT